MVDAFGNIDKASNGGTTYQASYSTATNQVTAGATASYDANGNQTQNGWTAMSWNAWSLPASVNGVTVTHDALGRMVETGSGSSYLLVVYRPSGDKLAIVQNGVLTKGTIPLPGGATAIYNASGLSYIRHKDWLGSSQLATTWNHTVYSKAAYAPYGETYNEAGTPDRSFTGQDQDTTAGVYDMANRHYDPTAGRWMSPDPAGWSAVDLTAPQSLNRYSYVQNMPLRLIDPSGLDGIDVETCGDYQGVCSETNILNDLSGQSYGSGAQCEGPDDHTCNVPAPEEFTWGFGISSYSGQDLLGTNNVSDYGGPGGGGAPNNPPQPCQVNRALATVQGAAPTGVNIPVDGHLEVGISINEATLISNHFEFYSGPFGANGYRLGNVIVSGHVNATSGQLSPATFQASPTGIVNAQVHFDTFNPSTGLFGLVGHTFYDYLLGKLFFRNSARLDKGC